MLSPGHWLSGLTPIDAIGKDNPRFSELFKAFLFGKGWWSFFHAGPHP